MEPKYRRFYVDWWNIRRSTIYGIVAILILFGAAGYGGWRLMRSDIFSPKQDLEKPKDAAVVISFEGDVRIIRAATRETILVTRQTFVSAGDTIQTQSDGRARVQMIDGSVLSIRANSTVVIRDSTSLFGGPNVRVTLDDGQINVRTDEQPENSQNVVEVRESENRIGPDTEASFDINKENNSGEIRISRGNVETTVAGQKTVVQANEFASLNNGQLGTKEKLLQPPVHNSPSSDEQLVGSVVGPLDVTFRWQSPDVSLALTYNLQVARIISFTPDSVVVDQQSLQSPSFVLKRLLPGTYYWRVRATSTSGQTSNWSQYWKFTVIKRESGRSIGARDWQVESLGGTLYRVSGKTQPGATVRAQGKSVFALGDGAFRLQFNSPTPQATIEVTDDRGNRSSFVLSLPDGRVLKQF